MTTEELKAAADKLRRERVPVALIKTWPWYRSMTEAERVEIEELIGFSVGNGPCDHETYVLALERLKHLRETKALV